MCLRLGAIPEVTVIVAIVISQICLWARLIMLNKATGFPVLQFVDKVYCTLLFKVVCGSVWLPLLIEVVKPEGFLGFSVSAVGCVLVTLLAVWLLGLQSDERQWALERLKGIKGKNNDKDNG